MLIHIRMFYKFSFITLTALLSQKPFGTTGRPSLCRKAFLKSFFLKTYFRLDLLRKLVRYLREFPYFQHLCGFPTLPHLATFARVAAWFREEGYEEIHTETLHRLGLQHGMLAVIDSTALRSSLYDSQAAYGKSTRLHMFKGYKLHLYTSVEGVALTYAFVPANRHDSAIIPALLRTSENLGLEVACVLGDAAYDSREIRETADSLRIQMLTAINKRNGVRKDGYGRVMSDFLQTAMGATIFNLRNQIERLFHTLTDKGLEGPRMFGYNRYHFHVQLVLLMHNIGYLL